MQFMLLVLGLLLIPFNSDAKPFNFLEDRRESPEKSNSRFSSKPVKRSDHFGGIRAGQFGAFNGATTLGLSYEYLYSNDFGLGAQVHYASYTKEITLGELKAELSNKAYTAVAVGNWHPHFVRSATLDPFLSIGLAHSFVSSEAKVTSSPTMPSLSPEFGIAPPALPAIQVDGDETFLVGSLNLRYFLDNRLSALGSLGLGLSTVMIGMDYRF